MRRSVFSAVVAAGFVAGMSAGPAKADVRNVTTSLSGTTVLDLLSGETYSFLVKWSSTGADIWKLSYLYDGVSTSAVSAMTFGATSTKDTTGQFTVAAGKGGTYVFSWSSLTNAVSVSSATVTGNFAAVPTPAPGPIAGAGLPVALALFGFGLYRRRANAA